jgi:hypothetical protein
LQSLARVKLTRNDANDNADADAEKSQKINRDKKAPGQSEGWPARIRPMLKKWK